MASCCSQKMDTRPWFDRWNGRALPAAKNDLGVWDGRLRGFNIIALAEMGKSVYKVKD